MTTPVLEPKGYDCAPGFVKARPENNAIYLAMLNERLPEPVGQLLTELDQHLEQLMPGYNISQIKFKWGSLRYYIDEPLDTPRDVVDEANQLIKDYSTRIDTLMKETS